MYIPFDQLPDHSRLWIYASERTFTPVEEEIIGKNLTEFCNQWTAHSAPLSTSWLVAHHCFIILAVDESSAGASGCSIDGSVRNLKALAQSIGADIFDRRNIHLLISGNLEIHPLDTLRSRFAEGRISGDDLIFDNLVATKGEWKMRWLQKVSESWAARFTSKGILA